MFTLIWNFAKFALGKFGLLSFIPGLGTATTGIVTGLIPLIQGLGNLIVWFFQTMWEGFKDMADNAASIIFVISLVAGIYGYSQYIHNPRLDACHATNVKLERSIATLKKQCGSRCR